MKLGNIFIRSIGTVIGEGRVDNVEQAERFAKDAAFLDKRIGVRTLPRGGPEQGAIALGQAAAEQALARAGVDASQCGLLILVTQNPDHGGLPHNSAVLQGALGMPGASICFDMGLGCSGYVYALCVASSLMKTAGIGHALIVTSDQYRAHLDEADVNTRLLFGDGASATVLSADDGVLEICAGELGTDGTQHEALIRRDGLITMNGRAVFDFSRRVVPQAVRDFAEDQGVALESLDALLLHQGSRAIVDEIARRLDLDAAIVPVELEGTGNTVSSSIPFLLQPRLDQAGLRRIMAAGFGVGLSWGCVWLERRT